MDWSSERLVRVPDAAGRAVLDGAVRKRQEWESAGGGICRQKAKGPARTPGLLCDLLTTLMLADWSELCTTFLGFIFALFAAS
jgi:hypothetical protein